MHRVMEVYRQLGFPGACGSMDGTHVKWSACPKDLRNYCSGEEGYPTLAWMIIVDHNRRILCCFDSVWGAENDIGIANNDRFVERIINGSLEKAEFILFSHPC